MIPSQVRRAQSSPPGSAASRAAGGESLRKAPGPTPQARAVAGVRHRTRATAVRRSSWFTSPLSLVAASEQLVKSTGTPSPTNTREFQAPRGLGHEPSGWGKDTHAGKRAAHRAGFGP